MSFLGNRPDSFGYSSTSYDHFNGDGTTTTFSLSRAVTANSDIFVTVGNVPQDPGVAYYVTDLYTLKFTGAPVSGSGNIVVTYRNLVQSGIAPAANSVTTSAIAANTVQYWQLAPSLLTPIVDTFTANGATLTFTLSQAAISANSCQVTVNGIVQNSPVNYSVNGTTLAFTSNPAAGSIVRVQQGSLTGTGVTPVDGSVTSAKLASNLQAPGTFTIGQPVLMMGNVINANTTVPAGYNSISVGPITLATGYTFTVAPGGRHIII